MLTHKELFDQLKHHERQLYKNEHLYRRTHDKMLKRKYHRNLLYEMHKIAILRQQIKEAENPV